MQTNSDLFGLTVSEVLNGNAWDKNTEGTKSLYRRGGIHFRNRGTEVERTTSFSHCSVYTVYEKVRPVSNSRLKDAVVGAQTELTSFICIPELTGIKLLVQRQKDQIDHNFDLTAKIEGEEMENNHILVQVSSLSEVVSLVQISLTIKDRKVLLDSTKEKTLLYT